MDNDCSFTARRGRCKHPLKAGNLARNSLPFVAFDWTNIFSHTWRKKPRSRYRLYELFSLCLKNIVCSSDWLELICVGKISEYISVCTEQNQLKEWGQTNLDSFSTWSPVKPVSIKDVSRSYTPLKRSYLTTFHDSKHCTSPFFSQGQRERCLIF